MADESKQGPEIVVPTEVPWQLAATTRTLQPKDKPPTGSSLSIYTYAPESKAFDEAFPNDRLVYVKISASIASDSTGGLDQRQARLLLQGGLPVWTSVLDVRISPSNVSVGGFRPYFIAVAPVRRTMLESGVVGDESFEGEADGLAVGKSGAQLHESYKSSSTQTSSSDGFSLFGIGVSKTSSGTAYSGSRDVQQVSDTTTREASEERQELFSHLTKVNNVLTLLTATGEGTPHLRFTLRPRPLRQLTIDPTDTSLWYGELLRRRSSGIEGIQDFFAIAIVPRHLDQFCIDAKLRNVYVLDNPPKPPRKTLWDISPWYGHLYRDYLFKKYPWGTPIDDLDVDITRQLLNETFKDMHQPVVDAWEIRFPQPLSSHTAGSGHVNLLIRGIVKGTISIKTTFTLAFYKTIKEVNLEMRMAKYREELATSPLVRGKVLFIPLDLGICFSIDEEGAVSPKYPTVTAKLGAHQVPPIGKPTKLTDALPTPTKSPYRADEVIKQHALAWNALETEVLAQLGHLTDWGETALRFDDPEVTRIWLRTLENLDPDDPDNRSLEEAAGWLGIAEEELGHFLEHGVTDVRGFAAMVNGAEATEQMHLDAIRVMEAHEAQREEMAMEMPELVRLPVDEADRFRSAVGRQLQMMIGGVIRPPE